MAPASLVVDGIAVHPVDGIGETICSCNNSFVRTCWARRRRSVDDAAVDLGQNSGGFSTWGRLVVFEYVLVGRRDQPLQDLIRQARSSAALRVAV